MIDRPDWNVYFMAMAYLVSRRSIDESTKVGCVITLDKSIISTGYNSPPRGMNDKEVPQTRPEKYDWMIHAEVNAIANAARIGASIKDSKFYCTDLPCPKCMGLIINAGCKRLVYADVSARMTDKGAKDTALSMAMQADVLVSRLLKHNIHELFGGLHEQLRTRTH